jgi:hypothetical protein
MPSLTPEAIYLQLGQHLAEMPEIPRTLTPEVNKWFGRLVALVECTKSTDISALKTGVEFLETNRIHSLQTIFAVAYAALARAELEAPAAIQGTFIATGHALDAFAAIGKVMATASSDILIVDPYADAKLITDFAVQAPEVGVSVRVLADQKDHKPTLKPAAESWTKQFGSTRPLEVRVAVPGLLHDRLIVVDGSTAYAVGQSFNKIAERAPTSIVRADRETGALKIIAYESLWKSAQPL